MSTDLALPPAMATCPVSYSPQCDNIVRRCRSGAEVVKGKLMMINMPTRYERSQISTRLGMVANALAGCAPKAIKADIRGMLNCYPSHQRLSEDDSNLVVAKYVSELVRFPAWAVARACGPGGLIRTGNAGGVGVTYPPSTIELALLITKQLGSLNKEVDDISAILQGSEATPPISEEERAAVGAKLRDLAEDLGAKVESDRQVQLRDAAAFSLETSKRFRDRAHAAAGTDPDSLASPHLAKALNRPLRKMEQGDDD